ncbi:hypothetical protein [uncultured Propionibacterium sp.]|nr:hypothetical protein [uncultured Propionibacterium sp.]
MAERIGFGQRQVSKIEHDDTADRKPANRPNLNKTAERAGRQANTAGL